MYRSTITGAPMTLSRENGELRATRFGALIPSSGSRFVTAMKQTWEFDGKGSVRTADEFGTVETFERVEPATPTPQQLAAYAGVYTSDDAETEMRAAVENDRLVLKRRPDTTLALTPLYADAFNAPGLGTVIFRRDASGQPAAFSVSQDRVWDLRFTRRMK